MENLIDFLVFSISVLPIIQVVFMKKLKWIKERKGKTRKERRKGEREKEGKKGEVWGSMGLGRKKGKEREKGGKGGKRGRREKEKEVGRNQEGNVCPSLTGLTKSS